MPSPFPGIDPFIEAQDRTAYLAKRNDMLRHGVNTVDLDFLLAGQRLPLRAPIPTGDFHAFVTRAANATECQVYSWTVRDPSPTIRIPLKEERSVALDLPAAFVRVWDRHRYSMQITYEQPIHHNLPSPIANGLRNCFQNDHSAVHCS